MANIKRDILTIYNWTRLELSICPGKRHHHQSHSLLTLKELGMQISGGSLTEHEALSLSQNCKKAYLSPLSKKGAFLD